MGANEQDEMGRASPNSIASIAHIAKSGEGIVPVGKPNPDVSSGWLSTKSTVLAAIFEPLLYPFAVLALRILIGTDRNTTP